MQFHIKFATDSYNNSCNDNCCNYLENLRNLRKEFREGSFFKRKEFILNDVQRRKDLKKYLFYILEIYGETMLIYVLYVLFILKFYLQFEE